MINIIIFNRLPLYGIEIRREMTTYTFSKMSLLGIVLFIFGLLFTVQGIAIRYHLSHANDSYKESEIKTGRYIVRDLTREQLVGQYYSEKNGTLRYGPYCNEDVLSSKQTYVAATNKDSNYYAPLIVSRAYQKDFEHMINGDTAYHMFGKFEKSDSVLHYDTIAECMGIDSKTQIADILSSAYLIRIIDPEEEKKVLYKGLSLFIFGLLTMFLTMKRDKLSKNSS